MIDIVRMVLLITAGWGGMYVLWRLIFRGAGVTILLSAGSIYALICTIDFTLGLVGLVGVIASAVTISLMRIVISPSKIPPINPSFETNQVSRGLTPIEAGYLTGSKPHEILTTALFSLADKDVISIKKHTGWKISQKSVYIPPGTIHSVEGRRTYRTKAARRDNLVLSEFEHALLELISTDGQTTLKDLDAEIWYKFVNNSMQRLANAYDFEKTGTYAAKVIEKMTGSNTGFSQHRKDLSGWFAAGFFNHIPGQIENHRPDWLGPDDDFVSFLKDFSQAVSD